VRHWGRSIFSACAVLVLLIGAGCGGGGGSSLQPAQSLLPGGGNPALPASINQVAAGPQTWQLGAGANSSGQAFQALNFFTDSITIDQGDSITWTVGGNAHTVTFFGPEHAPKKPVGARFGSHHYDGTVYTSSGAMFPGQSYTLMFTKAGTYAYECLFHDPEMAGVVIVQPKGAPYPHPQSYYTQQGNTEASIELAEARGSLSEFPYPDGGTTLAAGIAPGLASGGPSHSTVLRFIDADQLDPTSTIKISVGTTLTWYNQANNEPHTVTFPIAGHTPPPWLVRDAFGPPIGGSTYDGTHLDNSGPFFPGQAYSLTFTAPGTFTYYCLIHFPLGMIGHVEVH
jgi:plastocyanin